MFRGIKPTDISPENFGAGSTIEGSPGETWLVIADQYGIARVVNLQTFQIVDGSVETLDPNFMTEDDARAIVRLIDDRYTFSDYTLNPRGLK